MVEHRCKSNSRRGRTDMCWEQSQTDSNWMLLCENVLLGHRGLGTSNICKPLEWCLINICRWNWSTGQRQGRCKKKKKFKRYNRICIAVCWHSPVMWRWVLISCGYQQAHRGFQRCFGFWPNTRLGNNILPTYDSLGIFSWSWCSQLPDLKIVVYYFCALFQQMPHSNPDIAWFQSWLTQSL